jgi:hypothetical protein
MLNICHPVSVLLVLLLTGVVSMPARAQVTPPQPVPNVPDEPLPEWKPPPARKVAPIHLDVGPEARKAQNLRQAGLWLASFGGALLFASGIVFARAQDIADSASHYRQELVTDEFGNIRYAGNNQFDPGLEDEMYRLQALSHSFMIIGGAFTATGLALFGIGQARLHKLHVKHPRDPLPPLSGYDQVR